MGTTFGRALEYEVLGPIIVRCDGDPVDLGPPKARAVLAMLLCRGNRPVSVDALVDGLWPDAPPKSAVKNIQAYVHRLRRTLGDAARIVRDGPGYYRLVVWPGETDVDAFEGLIRDGRRAVEDDPERASRLFRQALALWRDDDAYADASCVPSVYTEARRLAEARLTAWLSAIDVDLRLGRYERLVPELTELTGRHPLQEGAWARLMTALDRSGRRADALRAYDDARHILVEETGLDPGNDLQKLQWSILTARPGTVRAGAGARSAHRP